MPALRTLMFTSRLGWGRPSAPNSRGEPETPTYSNSCRKSSETPIEGVHSSVESVPCYHSAARPVEDKPGPPTVIDFLWVSEGLLPLSPGALLAPVATSLPTIIVAAVAGAWPYQE